MQIPKPTYEDKDYFRSLVPEMPAVEVKAMFGNLGAFVNGNMFAGLFGPAVGVRLLQDSSKNELVSIDGSGAFGPEERPMSGYVGLPAAWRSQPELAAEWVEKALQQVAALPPKVPKARIARKAPRGTG